MKISRMSRYVACAAAGLVIAAGATAPAFADNFTPLNGPPSVSTPSAPFEIQPAAPNFFRQMYSVNTWVGSSGTVENLDHVTLCMYKAVGGDPDCANAQDDPTSEFEMTWTQASGSFSVTGTNNYTDDNSWANYFSNDLSTQIYFDFQVSDGMLAGPWKAVITAVDDQGQSTPSAAQPVTVDYYGAVTTPRDDVSYGEMANGASKKVEGTSDGAFIANASSDVTMKATNFEYDFGNNTIPLETATGPVGSGNAALDCNSGLTFGASPIRVTGSDQVLETGVFGTGTGETPDESLTNSCQLTYGGGAILTNQQYSNEVTVGIGAAGSSNYAYYDDNK